MSQTASQMSPDMTRPRCFLSRSQQIKYLLFGGKSYARLRARRLARRGEPELRLLPFLVDPQRNAVDVGANKGTYTIALSQLCRKVYSFEPNPGMRWILGKLSGNNVVISPKAVCDSIGTSVLRIPSQGGVKSNNVGSLRTTALADSTIAVEVETTTLDNENLVDVGFMKIDVEGLEQEVLKGARSLIQRDRPVLVVEIIQEHTGRDVDETIALIESWGYDTLVVRNGLLVSKTPGDGCLTGPDRGRNAKKRHRNFIFLPRQ